MKKISLIVILVMMIGLLSWTFIKKQKTNEVKNSNTTLEDQTNSEGEITIKVTPININSNDTQWKFKIMLDTHTVDLSQDLVANSQLIDKTGNIFKPTLWKGGTSGGHHREGELFFNAISPRPETIILKINGFGQERNFNWRLK